VLRLYDACADICCLHFLFLVGMFGSHGGCSRVPSP
jgi:hypothetical protein